MLIINKMCFYFYLPHFQLFIFSYSYVKTEPYHNSTWFIKFFVKFMCNDPAKMRKSITVIWYLSRIRFLKGKFKVLNLPGHVAIVDHCTEVRFASFLSGGFITSIVVDSQERKLAKRTSVQCVELKLRWLFCVHTSTCPEIYF